MNINQYLCENRNNPDADWSLAKTITCKSGLSLSVQASHSHYCSPRDNKGPWSQVEVGFPSSKVEELMPYAENSCNPCGTVYGYVPIEVVEHVIESNGGIA
jgi:hypothetical protein